MKINKYLIRSQLQETSHNASVLVLFIAYKYLTLNKRDEKHISHL